ncbi:MAG: DM13 domain-containing protein [Actinomycetota bacterium]
MTPRTARGARLATVVVSLALVAAACGSGDGDGGTAAGGQAVGPGEARAPQPLDTTPAEQTKSAPRWETIVTLSGTGPQVTAPIEVLPDAIQWRARWKCTTGTLAVDTDPPPRRPGPLVDSEACPGEGEGFSITTGTVRLNVVATGGWELIVDQQVETPLNEPPLPAMASARVLSQGEFYNVEKQGKGTARIYQLADGTRALRIEDLEVNQNTDLFVWLDTHPNPKTSADAVSGDYWVLGNLKSTLGSQNYMIPADVPLDQVGSIVIWCAPVAIAYAAAALTP